MIEVAISVPLTLLALPFALFTFFLAYITLLQSKKSGRLDNIPFIVRLFCYGILACAGTLDFVFNVTIGSLLFLDIPRELVFTSRCERHMHKEGWRGDLARWFCHGWLNPFEEGHCAS